MIGKTWIWIAAALAFASAAAPARAQTLPLEPDQVVLHLQAEGWVQTATARLVVSVDAALTTRELPEVRNRMDEVLRELADVDWRITRFDRREDTSGLVRWRIDGEARVPEPGLTGVHDRAKRLSKPGRQVRVLEIDFSPSVAEREAVVATLRADIYRQVRAERERLAEVFTDRAFRVRSIDFTGGTVAPPAPRLAYAKTAAVEMVSAVADAPIAISRKIQLTASVVLAAPDPVPGAPPGEESSASIGTVPPAND